LYGVAQHGTAGKGLEGVIQQFRKVVKTLLAAWYGLYMGQLSMEAAGKGLQGLEGAIRQLRHAMLRLWPAWFRCLGGIARHGSCWEWFGGFEGIFLWGSSAWKLVARVCSVVWVWSGLKNSRPRNA